MPHFVLPFVLPALVAPTDFAVFVTEPGGSGSVRMCAVDSPSYGTLPALTNIRLLECVPASRTLLDESFPGRALLRADLEQGTRVQLPNAHGSVYHYSRQDPNGASYGFFSIDANGAAHVLIELPAAPGPSDPFLTSVACKSNGSSLLVATQPNAGGDLWQLYSDGSPALNRTEGVPLLVFGRDSFFLSANLGAAVTTAGVVRFDPHTNDCADFVGFGPEGTPPWLDLELMPSANGDFVGFVAGESQAAARPFVLGVGGDALCMSSTPEFIAGVGCLPEAKNGPWLAVSDDGAQCAWRVGETHGYGYAQELFLARSSGGQTQTRHVTQDSLFEPYIDEIGLAYFRPGGQLCFVAGDPGQNQALVSRADFFSATLDASGALGVTNVSLTSGNATPPFLYYGTLELFALRVQPGSGSALLYSREESAHRLVAVDASAPGLTLVQDGVEGIGPMIPQGDEWVVGLDVPGGNHDTGLAHVEIEWNPEIDVLLDLPTLGGATRFVQSSFDQHMHACVCAQGAFERAWQVDISNGNVRQFSQRDLHFGRSMAYTLDGSLALSIVLGSGESLFAVWPPAPGLSHKLWPIPQTGFVLPGA